MKCFRDNKEIDRSIVMLDENNPREKAFRMARGMLKNNTFQDLKLQLISERSMNDRVYNCPTISEVAALIVGDIDSA
ncbi:unnamed protein product [Lathyrus sativus]|nr:unnamed protein product [Lathyrus sativus]